MFCKKNKKKKGYVLKAEPGEYKITGMPIGLIKTKIKILRNPKNITLTILGTALVSVIGFILGGIIGAIVGFIIAVVLVFIIGPTKEKITNIERR